MSNAEYVCSSCGHEQEASDTNCEKCGSERILLIKVAKALFGKRWKNRLSK